MEPSTAEDWMAIAYERLADAEAIFKERPASAGSVYMAGYAIECSLKALLHKRGIAYPRRGQEGHNLGGLWKASGFNMSDIQDRKGTKAFFIQEWSTDWRYEKSLATGGLDIKDLLDGARKLSGWIEAQMRPTRRQR